MAEWDFALPLAFLADTHCIDFTQLIGKKPINYAKTDGYRFGLGYDNRVAFSVERYPDVEAT